MRPQVLEQYSPSLLHRFVMQGLETFFGASTVDPARAAYYQPEKFLRPYYQLQHQIMRGPSEWSVKDRELMAAVVSVFNECEFCTTVHSSLSFADNIEQKLDALLDGDAGEWSPGLKTMLRFLQKLTQQPWLVTSDDIEILREQGLSDGAIEDAVMVCIIFNVGNRVADACDLEIPTREAMRRAGPVVRLMGYTLYTI